MFITCELIANNLDTFTPLLTLKMVEKVGVGKPHVQIDVVSSITTYYPHCQ